MHFSDNNSRKHLWYLALFFHLVTSILAIPVHSHDLEHELVGLDPSIISFNIKHSHDHEIDIAGHVETLLSPYEIYNSLSEHDHESNLHCHLPSEVPPRVTRSDGNLEKYQPPILYVLQDDIFIHNPFLTLYESLPPPANPSGHKYILLSTSLPPPAILLS